MADFENFRKRTLKEKADLIKNGAIAKHAGAGTLVPITGFANAVSSPAIEFKSEGYVTGLGAKMFIIAGPVIVYGTVAATLYGLLLWSLNLFGIRLF